MKKIFTLLAGILLATGAQAQDYYKVESTMIFLCNESNVKAAFSEGLLVSAVTEEDIAKAESEGKGVPADYTMVTNKKGNIDPLTGESCSAKTFPGLGLKSGNHSKTALFHVKGMSKITAYVVNNGSKKRTSHVVATSTDGLSIVEDSKTLTAQNVTATIELKDLDPTKEYDVDFNHAYEGDDEAAGGDMTLHGVWFIVEGTTAEEYTIPEEDPAEQTAANAWNFTVAMSDADLAALNADETNWEYDSDDDKYTYAPEDKTGTQFDIKAGDVVLELTKGIKMSRFAAGKVAIYPGKRLNYGGGGFELTIPGLVKNDEIIIEYATTSEGEDRGITKPGNCKVIDGTLTSTEKASVTLKVRNSGDVTFATTAGLNYYRIALNKALPEEGGATAIKTAKTATQQNGVTYNLAGQQVNDSFKGIVIQNGTKRVQK